MDEKGRRRKGAAIPWPTKASNIEDAMIRLSIGLEDTQDPIDDLARALR